MRAPTSPDTTDLTPPATEIATDDTEDADDPAELEVDDEAAEPAEAPTLVLVVGSGRSGTSVLAGALQRLGFHVPEPEVAADETNPLGFAEPQWAVDFHTAILRRLAVHTTDARPTVWARTGEVAYDLETRRMLQDWLVEQFDRSPQVVVKDPRLLWFVPLWSRTAEDLGIEPRFVTMLRHPAQVVASKQRWYEALDNPPNRLAGWLNTMLYTERATRGARRALVQFDDLLSDWTRTIARVDEQLDLSILRTVRLRHMQAVSALINPELNRSTESWDEIDAPATLVELAERVWDDLSQLAGDEDSVDGWDNVLARLDVKRQEYQHLYAQAEAVAYSSILAAERTGRRQGQAAARRAAEEPAEVATQSTTTRTRLRKNLGRLGRTAPAGLKRFVPEALKGPLRRRLA
jgi:hypothetical protein